MKSVKELSTETKIHDILVKHPICLSLVDYLFGDDELQEMQDNGEQEYRGRLLMSILMILCGIFGILSVLIAFEKIKCRGLWLFVLAAVLLSAGSVLCSLLLGRGLLYTAVFVVFFGLILLPLTTTGHKKVKQS